MSKDALLKQYSPVSRAQFNCWEGRAAQRDQHRFIQYWKKPMSTGDANVGVYYA